MMRHVCIFLFQFCNHNQIRKKEKRKKEKKRPILEVIEASETRQDMVHNTNSKALCNNWDTSSGSLSHEMTPLQCISVWFHTS